MPDDGRSLEEIADADAAALSDRELVLALAASAQSKGEIEYKVENPSTRTVVRRKLASIVPSLSESDDGQESKMEQRLEQYEEYFSEATDRFETDETADLGFR